MNNWNPTEGLDDVLALFETSNYIFYVPDSTSAFQAVRNGISQASLAMM